MPANNNAIDAVRFAHHILRTAIDLETREPQNPCGAIRLTPIAPYKLIETDVGESEC